MLVLFDIMIQILRQIVVIISAIFIVLVAGGFNLYEQYCYCSHEYSGSVIVELLDCHENDASHLCNIDANLKNDAGEEICAFPEPESQTCKSSDNCCKTKRTYLKTDVFEPAINPTFTFGFIAAYISVIESPDVWSHQINFLNAFHCNNDPPAGFGKYLLIELHQFKIPPFLA